MSRRPISRGEPGMWHSGSAFKKVVRDCSHQLIDDLGRKPKRLRQMERFNGRPLTDAEKPSSGNYPAPTPRPMSKKKTATIRRNRFVPFVIPTGAEAVTQPAELARPGFPSLAIRFLQKIVRDVSAALDPPQDGFAGANMTKITLVCR